jgi:putative sporulation protein YyaC
LRDGWKGLLSRSSAAPGEQRVHMDSPDVRRTVGGALYEYGLCQLDGTDEVIVLCIGTDLSIGDSLGPLVGSYLVEAGSQPFTVLGTLDQPVHATNLAQTVAWVESTYRNPLVIAVDACLGRAESVGMLTVGKGSLKPGAGVNKSLPSVGDLYLTGVVNVGGFMEYFVLQNTRLSLVMRMARVAAEGIAEGLSALAEAKQGRCTDKEIRVPVGTASRRYPGSTAIGTGR